MDVLKVYWGINDKKNLKHSAGLLVNMDTKKNVFSPRSNIRNKDPTVEKTDGT